MFSERFHLSPTEFWDLTLDEFDAYMKRLAEVRQQHDEMSE